MRVGVYIDGFNLYYGARVLCGRGTAGWRWLDVRALAADLAERAPGWESPEVRKVVYCTARIDGASNPGGHAEQDIYLKALLATGTVDLIEYGHYVSRVKKAPLATPDRKGRPVLAESAWPVMVQDQEGTPIPSARFMVSYAHREEKGSDVNVASHLLVDVLEEEIDAAIVISNDSDLRLPIQQARERVPVGTVNPSRAWLAGDLKGQPTDGVGRHWWLQLKGADIRAHQLPNPCGRYTKPPPW